MEKDKKRGKKECDWDLSGKMSHGRYKFEIILGYRDRLNYHGTLKDLKIN